MFRRLTTCRALAPRNKSLPSAGQLPPLKFHLLRYYDRKGKAAFDAYLYLTDSGTIFRAGTTKIAAEIIQTGIECGNAKLSEDLSAVLVDHL